MIESYVQEEIQGAYCTAEYTTVIEGNVYHLFKMESFHVFIIVILYSRIA